MTLALPEHPPGPCALQRCTSCLRRTPRDELVLPCVCAECVAWTAIAPRPSAPPGAVAPHPRAPGGAHNPNPAVEPYRSHE